MSGARRGARPAPSDGRTPGARGRRTVVGCVACAVVLTAALAGCRTQTVPPTDRTSAEGRTHALEERPASDLRPDAHRLAAHTRFLASDLLTGRLPGTAGFDVAAAYVAAELAQIGLEPVARPDAEVGGGYLLPVPLRRRALVPGGVRLTLRTPADTLSPQNGVDVAVDASATERVETLAAPLVFVGWGITAPTLGIDDYAGLDVRGKAVVLLEGAPATLPGAVRAHYSWIQEKERIAAAHGAVAVLTLKSPARERVSPWERTRALRPRPWLGLASVPDVRATISLGPSVARALFAAAGRSITDVYAASERGTPAGFPLPVTMELRRRSELRDVGSANVVGLLRGRDPALRHEYLVVVAHLDHVGVGAPVAGDSIYNGAVDNAGGVAAMLEVARLLASGGRPRRSVLFVAATAEEQGILGAEHLAAHPPVPRERIVGAISVDGLMAFHDFTGVVALGAEHSTLGVSSARAARAVGAVEVPDPQPARGNLALSDQYPFLRRGIPVLFPNPAPPDAGDAAGRAAWDAYEAQHYHRPSDDLRLPLRWDVAARWTRYVGELVRGAADADVRPTWYEGDPLAEVFAPGGARVPRAETARQAPPAARTRGLE